MKYILNIVCALSWLALSAHDQEKIVILSYGSLVKRPAHSVTGVQLHATEFLPTSLYFPIDLSLLKNTDRITAVINTATGSQKRVWAAQSLCATFEQAAQNLAAREGASFLAESQKYDVQYIFYIKKAKNKTVRTSDEKLSSDKKWIIKNDSHKCQMLSEFLIDQLIKWAADHRVSSILWTSCPIVAMPYEEFIKLLLKDDTLLYNAQYYIRDLPDGPETPLEKAIDAGKESLTVLLTKSYGKKKT